MQCPSLLFTPMNPQDQFSEGGISFEYVRDLHSDLSSAMALSGVFPPSKFAGFECPLSIVLPTSPRLRYVIAIGNVPNAYTKDPRK